jgi:hypothetical protein
MMENIGTDYEEFFDPATDQWIEPISNGFNFNYSVLTLAIDLQLECAIRATIQYPNDRFDELALINSACENEIEQTKPTHLGGSYEERLYIVIRHNRKKAKKTT